MPAWKALLFVLVLGLIVATGVFWVLEDARPPFVERMFLASQGFSPAKTPGDALDKFKEAIRKRHFKAAATFCTGEYGDELKRAAKKARALAVSVDDLIHNVEEVANINSPQGKLILRRLEPFPRDFKVINIRETKEGDDKTYAQLLLGDDRPINATLTDLSKAAEYQMDPRIIWSLVPNFWDGTVELRKERDGWKILIPTTPFLREKIQYLRDNGGNYVRAMDNLKYSIKHEAATKLDFEQNLRKQLDEAK
jgi:hypothetical protein